MAVITWASTVNKFAEPAVRIQVERGHRVIDTGPYALVRHPFYAGMLLVYLALVISAGGLGWSENGNDYSRYLPVLTASVQGPSAPQVAVASVPVRAAVRYLSGGDAVFGPNYGGATVYACPAAVAAWH